MQLQHTFQAIFLEFAFTMSHANLKNKLSNYEARNQEDSRSDSHTCAK